MPLCPVSPPTGGSRIVSAWCASFRASLPAIDRRRELGGCPAALPRALDPGTVIVGDGEVSAGSQRPDLVASATVLCNLLDVTARSLACDDAGMEAAGRI